MGLLTGSTAAQALRVEAVEAVVCIRGSLQVAVEQGCVLAEAALGLLGHFGGEELRGSTEVPGGGIGIGREASVARPLWSRGRSS